MDITYIIYTEDLIKLKNVFNLIFSKNQTHGKNLLLLSKGYLPWEDDELRKKITTFNNYYCNLADKNSVHSVVEMVFNSSTDNVIIFDENTCTNYDYVKWDAKNTNVLYCDKNDLLKLKLDTKYKTINWFIIDVISQKYKSVIRYYDSSDDNTRYMNKISSPLFNEKIIYIDGGLGDHIMALPLLNRIGEDIFVSCKYPFIFEHLKLKGFVNWNDQLFGGYERFVYAYGNSKNSPSIIDAFFSANGYKRTIDDVLVYNGKRESNTEFEKIKNIALICTSAAKINGLDSNKDWRDIRWFKLVHELQKRGYYVVQVGSHNDNQIPNVNYKFLDRPLPNLVSLIDDCDLWISVDTFFHHLASTIKPSVGICLTPFYNDHAKHVGVSYVEKDCGKNYYDRRWWLDLQQPERKECMDLIMVDDVLNIIK